MSTALNSEMMFSLLQTCGFHQTWKSMIYSGCNGDKLGHLAFEAFSGFFRRMLTRHHDEASQFVYLLTGAGSTSTSNGRNYLIPEDFVPLIQDVVDTHPGLGFLKEATEFHSRYVHTVIARIFFSVNRSWSGRITPGEIRKSNFLAVLRVLEDEDDINQITDFFSYEHFYVIYCKFWELDKDHDLFIDREDLSRHNDHGKSLGMYSAPRLSGIWISSHSA